MKPVTRPIRPPPQPTGASDAEPPHLGDTYCLGYARPGTEQPVTSMPYAGQLGLGLAAVVGAFATIGIALRAMASVTSLTDADLAFVIVSVLGLLIVTTIVARVRWRWRGFLVGVLIGVLTPVGLALLLLGMCTGIIR